MRPLSILALIGMSLPLIACSSVIEGRSQQLQVNTNPPGASCQLMRQGEPIGSINPTPGGITIEKNKYDINIKCNKAGYDEATYLNHSDADAVTAGNALFGLAGGIGWGIDSASGADNKYDTPVNITLPKK